MGFGYTLGKNKNRAPFKTRKDDDSLNLTSNDSSPFGNNSRVLNSSNVPSSNIHNI